MKKELDCFVALLLAMTAESVASGYVGSVPVH
jgi:hypothetical protein